MTIESFASQSGNELTISIEGRFDFSAHQEFRDCYERVNAEPAVT